MGVFSGYCNKLPRRESSKICSQKRGKWPRKNCCYWVAQLRSVWCVYRGVTPTHFLIFLPQNLSSSLYGESAKTWRALTPTLCISSQPVRPRGLCATRALRTATANKPLHPGLATGYVTITLTLIGHGTFMTIAKPRKTLTWSLESKSTSSDFLYLLPQD